MDMQGVILEIVYKPGKDMTNPLEFLSRHLLPETRSDRTNKEVKAVINSEQAVVLKRL